MSINRKSIKEQITISDDTFLNRIECNIMRGIAILFIIVDNMIHFFNGVFMDNEYIYRWDSVQGFINNLIHPNTTLPFNLISFYCPYGVMLFIFLSGYCLTLKYEKGHGRGTSTKVFICNHYQKLFVMQLKGLALFLTAMFLLYPNRIVSNVNVFQFFLVGNLIPLWECLPGPYWFFGMLMEMYVIYRLIIYNRNDWVAIALTVFSIVAMAFLEPESSTLYYLRINCFLAILPFCIGVLAARHFKTNSFSLNKTSACWLWFLLAFALLTASKFNFYSWLIMPVFIIITAVTLVKLFVKVKFFDTIFGWLGTMSGVLFVIHPIVREIMIERMNNTGHFYGMLLIYLLITLGLCLILKPAFISNNKNSKLR